MRLNHPGCRPPKIANIKTLVDAMGGTSRWAPPRIRFDEAVQFAERQGIAIGHDGRCYVPYKRFVRRSLRKNPKDAG